MNGLKLFIKGIQENRHKRNSFLVAVCIVAISVVLSTYLITPAKILNPVYLDSYYTDDEAYPGESIGIFLFVCQYRDIRVSVQYRLTRTDGIVFYLSERPFEAERLCTSDQVNYGHKDTVMVPLLVPPGDYELDAIFRFNHPELGYTQMGIESTEILIKKKLELND